MRDSVAQPGVQGLGGGERARGVVRQQRRHFQRHPAVHAARPVPDRSKQVGGPGQVLQRQLENSRSPDLPSLTFFRIAAS